MGNSPTGSEEGSDIIYGRNPVRALLESNPDTIHRIVIARGRKDPHATEIAATARSLGIPVAFQPRDGLDRIAGSASHQGIVARIARIRFRELEDVMAAIEERGSLPLLIALDQIVDPHNLGAISRTAEAAGADALIVPRHHSAVPSGAAFKASAGALGRIPLCRVTNLSRALSELKERGVWVVGTSADEGTPPWELDLSGPLVVVIGSEEKGMRPGVRAACDFMAAIPIAGKTGSLNASVATGMILYEIVRGRPAGTD